MAQQVKTHTIVPGETLATIASKYGVSVEALKMVNPEAKKYIYAGMELVIPNVKKSNQQQVVNKTSAPRSTSTNKVFTSPKKDETYDSHKRNPFTFDTQEGNAGKTSFALDLMLGYLIPSLGEASDYMESGFSVSMSTAIGARYYPVNNVYVEGMAGMKWIKENVGLKGSDYSDKLHYTINNITIPLHVGVSIPSPSNVSLGLFGGTRIDIPVSSKVEVNNQKSNFDVPVTAMVEVGLDINFDENGSLRLQYDYSPSESNKYSLISIGYSYGL